MLTKSKVPPRETPAPVPTRVLLVDGPAKGRDVPGSPGTIIRVVRRTDTLVYEREYGAATAFYVGAV